MSVPGPPSLPTYPLPPTSPPGGAGGSGGASGAPAPKLSSAPKSAGNFRLLDSLERYWDFSTDRGASSVVLVEFVTTSCPHCKPAVPVLKDLQSRYGASGFQVVAVLCDEIPLKQRAEAAGKYARDNNVNYAVFVEPGTAPGDVRDRFVVEGYPTAVLLDPGGGVLWKGHPVVDNAKLDAAIKKRWGSDCGTNPKSKRIELRKPRGRDRALVPDACFELCSISDFPRQRVSHGGFPRPVRLGSFTRTRSVSASTRRR